MRSGIDWNPVLNGDPCDDRWLSWHRGLESDFSYNFLFFLAGLQAIPKSVIEAGRDRWRAVRCDGSGPSCFPLLSPTTFFLIIVNITYVFFNTLRHHRHCDRAADRQRGHHKRWSTRCLPTDGKAGTDLGGSAAQSVILMVIVDRTHRSFSFKYVEKKVALLNAMVEHRPLNDIIAYAILTLIGVFIVAFPVYIALIASTHDAATVVAATCR